MFSQQEQAYLQTQLLARLATIEPDGQPDVDVAGFEFDGARFYIGGYQLETTRKYKNIVAGKRKVSLIIDDLKTREPWAPRAIKIHGTAEVVEREGRMGPSSYIAITPTVSWSWGIEEPQFRQGKAIPRKITWT
jgi:pyridoxamine 5'-phosphate oxidase family protein